MALKQAVLAAAVALSPQVQAEAGVRAELSDLMVDRYSNGSATTDGYLAGEPIPRDPELDRRVDATLSNNSAFNAALAAANRNVQEGVQYALTADPIQDWEINSNGYPMSLDPQGHGFVKEGPAGRPVKVLQNNDDPAKLYGDDGIYFYNNVHPTEDGTGFIFPKEGVRKPQKLQS